MIKALFNHKSIRNYKNEPISDEILNQILQGAIRGSNTGNMQLYSIIVTKNEQKKKQLWESHFKQNMVVQAPIILTFVADINRFHKWCKLRKAGTAYDNFLWLYNATIDATIAAQNAAIVAEDNNLGICYLGTTTYMAKNIIDILKLPKGVIPVTTLVIGYPDENPPLTSRLPQNAVVFNEEYPTLSDDDIENLHKDLEDLDFSKDLVKLNETENLAQVFTKKRYKKADNLHFSDEFLKIIEQQGFMNNK
ncbi:MAG: nitroreductase family protein [Bacteroidales bacterium]|nr:nitroreductase family protein [Bacteroidales bacterium]